MKTTWMAALVALALLGCSSDSPPGANVSQETTLPDSPLARLQNVSLIRAGDGFTLAGYDNGTVRWAHLSLAGVLTGETSFALPQPALVGPVFAVTAKSAPGDQLIAIFVIAATAGGYELSAVAQTFGSAPAAAPLVLAPLPDGTDPATVQLAAGAATTGNVGFVAWGIHDPNQPNLHIPVNYFLLPADAAVTTAPATWRNYDPANPTPPWDCLAAANGKTGIGLSVVVDDPNSPGKSEWIAVEFQETGASNEMTYPLNEAVANCQIVGSPAAAGSYFMAFQGSNAIGFATYYPFVSTNDGSESTGGSVTPRYPVLPAASFGGILNLPQPAWVAPAGSDISIGLSRTSGPEVHRFTYDGIPHGGALALRSANGQSGPVAAWVGSDGVYVTYADQVSAPGTNSNQRYFSKIVSPASLP
jgi:hypothetical protein